MIQLQRAKPLTAKKVARKKVLGKAVSQVNSFFDESFRTPKWLQKKVSRRSVLKSAAGATMVAAMPMQAWSALANDQFTKC